MEENVSWGVQQLRCKMVKFRSEKRDAFYKSMFSLKRTIISESNQKKDNDTLVYNPLQNHQIEVPPFSTLTLFFFKRSGHLE